MYDFYVFSSLYLTSCAYNGIRMDKSIQLKCLNLYIRCFAHNLHFWAFKFYGFSKISFIFLLGKCSILWKNVLSPRNLKICVQNAKRVPSNVLNVYKHFVPFTFILLRACHGNLKAILSTFGQIETSIESHNLIFFRKL